MPSHRLANDCFGHDRDMLRHDEALALLRDRLSPVGGIEAVPLAAATGRIAAVPVAAPRPVPAADYSAVDGYAFAEADYAATGGFFPIAGRIAAGHPSGTPLPVGSAARIFTGGLMPDRADTVAMQEDCETHRQDGRDFVVIPPGLAHGANRRRAGEDLVAAAVIVEAGTLLRPQEIGAVASTGAAEIACFAPLRVAVFSTGDEVLEAGDAFTAGAIYDANRPLLKSLLAGLPVAVTDLGILPDRPGAVADALERAAATHDVVLTTGGASRGEEDHLSGALEALGRRHLWHIAIKPGRPMMTGQIGDCIVLGLPGNPVSAFVCFNLYVRPALRRLGGGTWTEPRRLSLPSRFELGSKPDRREFLRGSLAVEEGRIVGVDKYPRDGSGLITSLRQADGLIEIPEATTSVSPGEPVAFLTWEELAR